jgi:hypothetical protein
MNVGRRLCRVGGEAVVEGSEEGGTSGTVSSDKVDCLVPAVWVPALLEACAEVPEGVSQKAMIGKGL